MHKPFRKISFILLSLLLICCLGSCQAAAPFPAKWTNHQISSSAPSASQLRVDYIDVGQGHAALIESEGDFMLIDAGPAAAAETLLSWLHTRGVSRLSYLIATHPHEDHIGGVAGVLKAIPVEQVIMPDKETSTRTFETMIDLLLENQIPVRRPVPGDTYPLGNSAFTILAPRGSDYKDLNDYSVVAKLVYGTTSFLFTGDATKVSEKEMLDANVNLQSTVLLVGHHGSAGSTSPAFLSAVSPKFAVISAGRNNMYGHPTAKVIHALEKQNILIYRTDLQGTITALSDGTQVSFLPVISWETPAASIQPIVYIGNRSSKVFHYNWCSGVQQMKEDNKTVFYTKAACQEAGYSPCKQCKP